MLHQKESLEMRSVWNPYIEVFRCLLMFLVVFYHYGNERVASGNTSFWSLISRRSSSGMWLDLRLFLCGLSGLGARYFFLRRDEFQSKDRG